MITLLTSSATSEILEEAILPIFIFVVLPCFIVWITINGRKHEVDKKTELALKAIEKGAEFDPNLFSNIEKTAKGFKEKVFAYLKTSIILSFIGIIFLVMGLIMRELKDVTLGFFSMAAIFVVLGVAFFLIYSIAKKKFSAEIAKEEACVQKTE